MTSLLDIFFTVNPLDFTVKIMSGTVLLTVKSTVFIDDLDTREIAAHA